MWSPVPVWRLQKAYGENMRSIAAGAGPGCQTVRIVTRFTQPKMIRNRTNAAPGNDTQRPRATPSSGPPSDGMAICPVRMAILAGVLNAPYSGPLTG